MTWWSDSAAGRLRRLRSRRWRGGSGEVCASSVFPPRSARRRRQQRRTFPSRPSASIAKSISRSMGRTRWGTLNLIKGLGGALLREKIVAAASHRLAIVVDGSKLVDRLGTRTAVPVEVVAFGLEATRESLEVLGASVRLRMSPAGQPFVTDGGNRILDCNFDHISDPARLEERIRHIVGVVESGLFIGRADPVFVADAAGVHRLDSARAHRGSPPILVIMGISGSGKSTVAQELAARLGWPFEEGDSLHPQSNLAKMHAGIPLTDADRQPWLARVAAWIDAQRAKREPGIITCSALKRVYRQVIA